MAFAVLTWLALSGWPDPSLRWRLMLRLVALGGGIEVAQHLTGWRHGEWSDWAADAVGVGMAALPVYIWHLRRRDPSVRGQPVK